MRVGARLWGWPLVRSAIVLAALAVPALLDTAAVGRAADLWPLGDSRYFAPAEGVLLYLRFPLAAVSAGALVLAPGLIAVQALRGAGHAGDWVLRGAAVSLVLVSAWLALADLLAGHALTGRAAALAVLLLGAVVLAIGLASGRRDAPVPVASGNGHMVAGLLVAPFVLAAALAPKFLWEAFNGDGAHAFEAARRLLYSASPFFPVEAGGIAGYPGTKTFLPSYPMSWFMRLFGEREAAVRAPFLLELALLHAGLVALLPRGSERRAAVVWHLWAALAVFAVVMAFSASYETYHADIALPGVADALTIAMMLGMIAACLQGLTRWAAAFTLLLYATTPAGMLLAGFWLAAMLAVLRPRPWRAAGAVALALALGIVAERVLPGAMRVLGLPGPGSEHAAGSLAARLLNVQLRDWHRVLYVIVPCGVLPALSLLWWRRQDPAARALTLLTLAVCAFFYVQHRFALHYLAPAMVLPLAVFWRTAGEGRALAGAAFGAAAAALVVSLPADPRPWLATRTVGMAVEDRAGGYREGEPAAFRRGALLGRLFARPSDPRVPREIYGGSPLAWHYYAQRRDTTRAPAYVIQRPEAPAPEGGALAAADRWGALYVMDSTALAAHRAIRPDRAGIARLYRLDRRTLFGR